MILSGCFGLLFIDESIGGGLLAASGWLITWLLKPLSLLTQFNFSTLDLSNNSQLLLVVGVLVGTTLLCQKAPDILNRNYDSDSIDGLNAYFRP